MSDLGFDDVLPHLVTLYRQGLLAPFIGSGMSVPVCTNWKELLKRLAKLAGVQAPELEAKEIPSTTLYRVADLTVSALRPLPHEERIARYRKALRGWDDGEAATAPPQIQALAKLYWPLVLTTNYDDLFWSSTGPKARPEIAGRHLEDCHRVLRSLDESSPPLLWALQGYFGGQVAKLEESVKDARRRIELANQTVLGHQQYQRVINSEPHFRRAFSEVFRRRSFLFVGSGLLEDYLVNLFGEIIHHHGLGPHPHFALLSCQEKERFDPWFLQTRLGIVPVFYKNHGDLPQHLNDLAAAVSPYLLGTRRRLTARVEQVAYDFSQSGADVFPRLKVVVCNAGLHFSTSQARECSVVSVGRWGNAPREGKMARLLVQRARLVDSTARWNPLDDSPSYVFRFGDLPLFGVAARRRDLAGKRHDLRDLGIIPEAVCAALKIIEDLGFEVVHLGALASGEGADWHPVHSFVQMLRGIRLFAMDGRQGPLQEIILHIVDNAVWGPIQARRIAVQELLSSDLVTYRLELRDADGGVESFAVTLRECPHLSDLLDFCKLDRRQWVVEIQPPAVVEGQEEPPGETVIVPSMKILLQPRG